MSMALPLKVKILVDSIQELKVQLTKNDFANNHN
jgi:hypothetical protein